MVIYYLKLYLKGLSMGIANTIPGISGGTIAFMMGIYEELIKSLKSFNLKFIKLLFQLKFKEACEHVNWRFLLTIMLGVLTSILLLSKLIVKLSKNYPVYVDAFFFGLIIATIPIISKCIKKWTIKEVVWMIIAAVVMYFSVKMTAIETTNALWFIFLSGVISISAMILPGISGAFILILLGKYQFILQAVNEKNMLILSIFILGAIVGIVLFVQIISWLFSRFHDMTISILTGIVLGSLYKIWPWKIVTQHIVSRSGKIIPVAQSNILPDTFNMEVFAVIGLITLGFILALLLNRDAPKEIEV